MAPSPDPRPLLQSWLDANGLTLRGWARLAGLAEGTLRAYLVGRSAGMTVAATRQLAEAVGIPFAILVEYTGGEVPAARFTILPSPA